MEFPDIQKKKEEIIGYLAEAGGGETGNIQVIASPYRICPLGAHIDHQGGSVLGMTINACTLMAFTPSNQSSVHLQSRNYPGEVAFDIDDIPEAPGSFWGVYPRAAVLALAERHELKNGLTGILDGMLPGCGLSSSASVLLAYLHAFAAANHLELEPWDYVNLTHRAEREYIGLNNGILDQASIVFGRRDTLLHIDTKEKVVTSLPDKMGLEEYRILVAFSGHSRELTTSGYNSRVDECRQAAEELSRMAGSETAVILSDVSREDYDSHHLELDPILAKRSNHFFSESARVNDGVKAWQEMRIKDFGRMMNESCRSSIEQYECGMQAICDLQHIVSNTDGVMGSRFMGGGFGGCVVGLVRPDRAAKALENISESYRKLHTEVADKAAFYLATSSDGVRFI